MRQLVLVLLALVAAAANADAQSWKTFNFGKGLSIQTPVKLDALSTPTQQKGQGETWVGTFRGVSLVIIVGPLHIANFKNADAVAGEEQKLFDYITSHNPSTVTSQSDLLVKGWPGMRFRFTKEGSLVQFTSYYLGSTSVLLSATYAPNVDASKICDRFFASFSVGNAARGPFTTPVHQWRKVQPAVGGVEYRLPGPPTSPYKDGVGGVRYGSQVLAEVFTGYSRAVKNGSASEATKLRAATVQENARLIQASSSKSREGTLNGERATWTTYILQSGGMAAKSVAVVHGKSLAFLLVLYPSQLAADPAFDRFFRSLRFNGR